MTLLLRCALLFLALAVPASAFQFSRELQVSCPALCSLSNCRVVVHNKDLCVRPSTRLSVISTRLKYREGSDDSSSASPLSWIHTIFPRAQRDEDDEQQSVDEYLEFLDRRYRRLHSSETEEGPKHFSALSWLRQGSPSRNDFIVTEQQKEDALYVLGVAGLASQKLLHRHHLVIDEETSPAHYEQPNKTLNFVDADLVQSGSAGLFVKKVILPLLRIFYIVQRRKDMFIGTQLQRVKTISGNVLRSVGKTLVHTPGVTAKAILDFGGGRKSLAVTFAASCTLFLLLRPILQAVLTEGAVTV